MIEKFDTGELGEYTFSFKVRKVQQGRGNKQGNNALLEDVETTQDTVIEYLQDEWF